MTIQSYVLSWGMTGRRDEEVVNTRSDVQISSTDWGNVWSSSHEQIVASPYPSGE